jgi:hypothetical protein
MLRGRPPKLGGGFFVLAVFFARESDLDQKRK